MAGGTMIGYFREAAEMTAWARLASDSARAAYVSTGNILSLGYAMAMADVAASVVGEGVETPAYQIPPAAILTFPAAMSDRDGGDIRAAA